MQAPAQMTEAEVRALRDRVYGHISTDKNWERCRVDWMHPANIAWLLTKDASPLKARP